jgi:hypothetical protein
MGKGKYDEIGSHADPRAFAKFTLGFIAVQVIGLVMVILSGVWMGSYHGGYGWAVKTVFNYHPLFMTMGMLFKYSLEIFRLQTSPVTVNSLSLKNTGYRLLF